MKYPDKRVARTQVRASSPGPSPLLVYAGILLVIALIGLAL